MCVVLLLCACGGGGGGSSPPAVTPPPPEPPLPDPQYRVSQPSPFAAGCDGAAVAGTLYVNADVEPFVAVNPANPANLIGVWQQDRWSNGGAKGNLAASSFDGGHTWTTSMAAFSRCTGGTPANHGDYERASDPWVAIGPDGIAYQIAIAFSGAENAAASSNAILVSRSLDGGRSWAGPIALKTDGADFFNDKNSITADLARPGNAYATWDRISSAGHGPTYFSRTTDGGSTWEPARQIYDPGVTSQTINNQVVVLTDGTLVTFFTRLDVAASGQSTATLVVIRSTDVGTTWSAPIVVSPVQSVGARDPETGAPIRDGSDLGSIAAGPQNSLVAVWQDARFSGGARDGVALSRSTDGGLTWSVPARINRNPGVQAFLPAVTVRGDGALGVLYYDFRSNTIDPATLPTDIWLARSTDGVNWLESRVSGPFDLTLAPNAGGLFLGDYQGMTAVGSVFVPFYVQTNAGDLANRTDVFASLVSSAGTAQAQGVSVEAMVAPSAQPLALTAELKQRVSDGIARVIERRRPGGALPGSLR